MATTKEKMEFFYVMAKHSGAIMADLRFILRCSATIQRLAETACNRELSPTEIKKQNRLRGEVKLRLSHFGCKVTFHGDPRGAIVKIQVPDGYTNDWGKKGICVPA